MITMICNGKGLKYEDQKALTQIFDKNKEPEISKFLYFLPALKIVKKFKGYIDFISQKNKGLAIFFKFEVEKFNFQQFKSEKI